MSELNNLRFTLVSSSNATLPLTQTDSLHQIDQNGSYYHYEVGVSLHPGPIMIQIVSSANNFKVDFFATTVIDPTDHLAIGSYYLEILPNVMHDGFYVFPEGIHPPGIRCDVSNLSGGETIAIVIGR